MKRKIISVLGVLMAIILSTAALAACEKTPAGADSSGDNGAQSDRRNLQLYFREIDHPQKYFRHIASVANPGTEAWFNLISNDYLLIDIDKDIFAVKYSE